MEDADAGTEFRVLPVTTRALMVVPIRIALGLAGLAVAAALSDRPLANLFRQFFVGAVIFGFVAIASETRRVNWHGDELDPLPSEARVATLSYTVADGVLPSTVGVTVLMVASLVFEPRLAALLAGLLAGMGLAALVSVVQLLDWERRAGARLYATPGYSPQLFAEPRPVRPRPS